MRFSLFLPAVLALALVAAGGHPKQTPAKHTMPASHLVSVKVDLDYRPHKRSTFGKLLGYEPEEVHVRAGDKIQFVNVDDENHTATGMSYTGQTAPANYKFQSDFTKPHGRIIDASEWSSGTLRAHGGKSQIFVAKRVGHYFYGCGYHIGQRQIGVIVVGP